MPEPEWTHLRVTALAGGVGGARLAHGLAALLDPGALSVVVNTGDDFETLGLTICPDLDTVTYTLAGLANPETGWGLAGDTTAALEALRRLGGPDWFRLGDRDLATHLFRTQRLRAGQTLTEVTAQIAAGLGARHPILPMCDPPCRTRVLTDEGELEFQEYFVRLQCRPRVNGFRWEGLDSARPTQAVLRALDNADLIVFCPSNPFVSIDPILNLPGVRERVAARCAVAVSPILGGRAVKGPAAKMFAELGFEPSALNVARRYRDLLRGFVLDEVDAGQVNAVEALGMRAAAFPTLMPGLNERAAVARRVLAFGSGLLAGAI